MSISDKLHPKQRDRDAESARHPALLAGGVLGFVLVRPVRRLLEAVPVLVDDDRHHDARAQEQQQVSPHEFFGVLAEPPVRQPPEVGLGLEQKGE
jgi:hypothetical protein